MENCQKKMWKRKGKVRQKLKREGENEAEGKEKINKGIIACSK